MNEKDFFSKSAREPQITILDLAADVNDKFKRLIRGIANRLPDWVILSARSTRSFQKLGALTHLPIPTRYMWILPLSALTAFKRGVSSAFELRFPHYLGNPG